MSFELSLRDNSGAIEELVTEPLIFLAGFLLMASMEPC